MLFSHPIHVAEYSLAQGISHEPAFNWWVTHVLKIRESIISALKGTASRVMQKNIKFGIQVPQTVIEALRLDKNNGNHPRRYGISKEINEVMIAFKLLDEREKPPPTYQEIRCHMIFDIKMEDFRKKAR